MDVSNVFLYTPTAGARRWTRDGVSLSVDTVITAAKIMLFGVMEVFADGHAQWLGPDTAHAGSPVWQMVLSGSPIGDSIEIDNSFQTGGAPGEVLWKAYGTSVQIINTEKGELFRSFVGEINTKLAARFPGSTGGTTVVTGAPPFTDETSALAWFALQLPLNIQVLPNGNVGYI